MVGGEILSEHSREIHRLVQSDDGHAGVMQASCTCKVEKSGKFG